MRALCDVGNSTKSFRTGYIGQKGIGFKSVFRWGPAAGSTGDGARWCWRPCC
jgi:hypothetical protein